MAESLALFCDVYCDFVTFSFGFLGQVWYLIVSIPDLCCHSYFINKSNIQVKLCFERRRSFFIYNHSGKIQLTSYAWMPWSGATC